MPDTYTLLEKIVVGSGGASSVTFTSIPQTYTDLVIKISARTTASAETGSFMRFNGSSAANYAYLQLRGDGSTATSTLATNQTETFPGRINDNAYTANTFSNGEVYIPNYSGSTNKCISVDAVTENNATTAQMGLVAGLRAITDPITSILIAPSGGNWAQHSTFYLYGVAKQGVTPLSAPKATGGDIIVSDGTYWIHTFLSSGTFRPLTALGNVDYLVIAGGGGGSNAGGGAGGYRTSAGTSGANSAAESKLSMLANTNYTVTVGAGGVAITNGNNSVLSGSGITTITAIGGGTGNPGYGILPGSNGGSGGGGRGAGNAGGTGTANQGTNGGAGSSTATGGGGGASQVGANATSTDGGKGGDGLASTITGSSVTRAGGGGGASGSGPGGNGGAGGGGKAEVTGVTQAENGAPNTGGGSGGSWALAAPLNGGSGIVVIRYAIA